MRDFDLPEAIREHVFSDEAPTVLSRYLGRQSFSGAWFETLGGRGDDPDVANRFTAADVIAVATLSVDISGWAAIDLLDRRADQMSEVLKGLPTDVPLHEATDDHLQAIYQAQDARDQVKDIGHVRRSKLLARKRPHLVPIRDQHVLLALMGRDHGAFTEPLRDALRAGDDIRKRLVALREDVQREDLSILRVLDIVVWMRTHGSASVA